MMTVRLLARTNDKNSLEAHSHKGEAFITMTDEYGQTANLALGLVSLVRFCHDVLARAREQYEVLPPCEHPDCANQAGCHKCKPLVRNENIELVARMSELAKPPAS